jgi:hypothetical protein
MRTKRDPEAEPEGAPHIRQGQGNHQNAGGTGNPTAVDALGLGRGDQQASPRQTAKVSGRQSGKGVSAGAVTHSALIGV